MPDLLLELFSEEIPARMQTRAAEDLRKRVTDGLVERGLACEGARAHAGPRRLTLDIRGLPAGAKARREERKGPRADAPDAAVQGFLRATGLTRAQLETRPDKKGDVLFAVIETPGRAAADIVAEVVAETIRGFAWPKSMRWGAGSLRWVRPLHAILCQLSDEGGSEVVPFEIDGIASGVATRGHRFMAPDAFAVRGFDDYAAKLAAAKVIVDADERARRIRHDAGNLAFAQGLEVVEDAGLLAEVAGLVEWPVCLMGEIGAEFLDLPPEVLRTSMKTHQKFFSVRNPATGRIEKFITVANIDAPDHGATILNGNRRVLTARLSDARFFWENDRRKTLEEMAAPLAGVTFHNKLGSQAGRVARIAALAREIAPHVGADPDMAERAARIAKADLASAMVGEFPELQGIMGRYYALAAGEAPEVANACAEHYQPMGPSDSVPSAPVSVAVALADKIDMLTGFWAIDEKPTGSKDPFALRRAALGVIRLVLRNEVRLNLMDSLYNTSELKFTRDYIDHMGAVAEIAKDEIWRVLLSGGKPPKLKGKTEDERFGQVDDWVQELYGDIPPFDNTNPVLRDGMFDYDWPARDLLSFLHDRLKVHLRERAIRHDVIDACLTPDADDLTLLVARIEALQGFLGTDDGANLLTGYRRAANILAAEEKKDGVEYSLDPDPKFAETDAERALFAALDRAESALEAALGAEDFPAAMTALSRLRAPIDAFFDKVTVNAENPVLRRNRLCLLTRVRTVMERVAAFGAIEG